MHIELVAQPVPSLFRPSPNPNQTQSHQANYPSIISCFPQMKPEKQEQIDGDDQYLEIGVPKEWIDPLKALGFTSVARLKEVE